MYNMDCPFCGQIGIIQVDENDSRNDYYVKCPECGQYAHVVIESDAPVEKYKTVKIPKEAFRQWEKEHGYR